MMTTVCRLCLQVTSDPCYSVDENAAEKKITILMPELNLNVVTEPILCESCYGTLQAAYDFKCICLANEQRITEYLNNGKQAPINLCDLLDETESKSGITATLPGDNFNANANVLDIVKEEPLILLDEFVDIHGASHVEVNEVHKSRDTPIKCSNCSSEFVVLKEYRNHLNQCARYKCDVCNKKFKLKGRFLKHKVLHNSDVEEGSRKDTDGKMSRSQTIQCVSPNREHSESNQPDQDKWDVTRTKRDIKHHSNSSVQFAALKVYKNHLKQYSSYKREKRLLQHKLSHKTDGNKSKSVDEEESNKRHPEDPPEKSNEIEIKLGMQCLKCHREFTVDEEYRKHTGRCAPHQCDKCRKKFASDSSLQKHKLSHNDTSERKYMCEVCSKTFHERYRLQQHLVMHTGQRSLKCPICDKMYPTKPLLAAHKKIVHSEKQREKYVCEICGRKTPTLANLQKHRSTHSKEKKFFCEICEKGFKVVQYLQEHKRRHLKGDTKRDRKHICDTCKVGFLTRYALIEHHRSHTGERPYKCTVCDQSFAQGSTLKTHVMSRHSNERQFACEVCGKRFNVKGALTKHLAIHLEKTEKFPCPHCNRIFNLSRYLDIHIKRHTKEPAYTCSACSKAFYTTPELKKHMRIHTGEKPYECEICHHRFTQNYNKQVHMKVHR